MEPTPLQKVTVQGIKVLLTVLNNQHPVALIRSINRWVFDIAIHPEQGVIVKCVPWSVPNGAFAEQPLQWVSCTEADLVDILQACVNLWYVIEQAASVHTSYVERTI